MYFCTWILFIIYSCHLLEIKVRRRKWNTFSHASLILFIRCIMLTVNKIFQQTPTIWSQTVRKVWKLRHVSAPRRHPQGISNTQEYKHVYILLNVIEWMILCYGMLRVEIHDKKHNENVILCTIYRLIIFFISIWEFKTDVPTTFFSYWPRSLL
jgi:hypothetical protein